MADSTSNIGLPKSLLNEAYQKNWFKLFVLRKFSGLQCSLPDALKIIKHCNKENGSFGWCITLGASANYLSGFFNEFGAFDVFDHKNSVMAAGEGLATEVEEVKDGFLITGKWKNVTGSLHATYFTCKGKLPSGEVISFAMKPSEVELINDWKLVGMKQSSSYSFSAHKAFVSKDNIFKIDEPYGLSSYSIHKLPFDNFTQFIITAAAIGLAEGIIENLVGIDINDEAKDAVQSLIHYCKESEEDMIQLAKIVWSSMKLSKKVIEPSEIQEIAKSIGQNLFKLVNEVYFKVGSAMANESKTVHTQYKDFMVAIQHSIFK